MNIDLSVIAITTASSGEGDTLDTKVVNIVATSSTRAPLDLHKISNMIKETDYNPKRFPGLIYRLKKPKTTTLMFSTGKLVCTGGKTIEMVDKAVNTVLNNIAMIGIGVPIDPEIKIQNIVATSDLKRELNLPTVAMTLGLENVEYEPEQFPGLVYRVDSPKVVMLLFGSGKVVIVGAKKVEEIEIALQEMRRELSGATLLN